MVCENDFGLLIEIGPGQTFPLLDFSSNKPIGPQRSAKGKIKLDAGQPLQPTIGPYIVAVRDAETGAKIFGGLLFDRDITFEDEGVSRIYDLNLEGFFYFTAQKKIRFFRPDTTDGLDTVTNIVEALLLQSGAADGARSPKLLNKGVVGDDGTRISFTSEESLYLHELFDRLAAQEGYTWYLTDGDNWTNVNAITTAAISNVIFTKNGTSNRRAPRDPMRIPTTLEPNCPGTVFWIGDPKLQEVSPRISLIRVIGRNGDLVDSIDDPLSVPGVTMYDLPPAPVRTKYPYESRATRLVQVTLASKGGDPGNPCDTVTLEPTSLLLVSAVSGGMLVGTGTLTYQIDLRNPNLMNPALVNRVQAVSRYQIDAFVSSIATPLSGRVFSYEITFTAGADRYVDIQRDVLAEELNGALFSLSTETNRFDIRPYIGMLLDIVVEATVEIGPGVTNAIPPISAEIAFAGNVTLVCGLFPSGGA